MATGYTEILLNNPETSFFEFASRCARAMGAFIHMRADSLDAPLNMDFVASTHHRDAMDADFKKRKDIEEMTDAEVARAIETEIWWNQKTAAESRAKLLAEKAVFEAMLAKVEAWSPPTAEHENFKKFMLDQLRMSLPSDSLLAYYPKKIKKAKHQRSVKAWRKHELARIDESIEYYRKHWECDLRRAGERSAWAAALIDSLKEHG